MKDTTHAAEPAPSKVRARSRRTSVPGTERLEPAGGPSALQSLSPGSMVTLQRHGGNTVTRRWLAAQGTTGGGRPTLQRSVYLANEDDYIYKSEQDTDEYAYLMKYAGSYPLFIKYDAIEKLAKEPILKDLWTKQGGVEEYFRLALIALLDKKGPEAATVKGHIGYPYLYDAKSGTLAAADLGHKGLAMTIAAAMTGGAKVYQQGGGSRLPRAVGILTTFGKGKQEVLAALGVPEDRWPEYQGLHLRKLDHWGAYEMALASARSSPAANLFEYATPETNTYFFYLSAVEVQRNLNARIQIAGTRFADADFLNIAANSPEETQVKGHFDLLGKPTGTDWVAGTQLNRKDRGEGQAKAMNNWNALGAAAYANKFLGANYPLNQNWEWLHVRGAQIGGATDASNLVPGLYVTNSFMIPYENMIEQWARADPTHFWARFSVSPSGTLYARYITISFLAKEHKMLGDFGPHDLVKFDVLGGRVVDKLANEIIKRNIDRRSTVD